jgi:chromate transport protein ChrA
MRRGQHWVPNSMAEADVVMTSVTNTVESEPKKAKDRSTCIAVSVFFVTVFLILPIVLFIIAALFALPLWGIECAGEGSEAATDDDGEYDFSSDSCAYWSETGIQTHRA